MGDVHGLNFIAPRLCDRRSFQRGFDLGSVMVQDPFHNLQVTIEHVLFSLAICLLNIIDTNICMYIGCRWYEPGESYCARGPTAGTLFR